MAGDEYFIGQGGGEREFRLVEGVMMDASGNKLAVSVVLRFASGTTVPHVPPIIRFDVPGAAPELNVTGEFGLREIPG